MIEIDHTSFVKIIWHRVLVFIHHFFSCEKLSSRDHEAVLHFFKIGTLKVKLLVEYNSESPKNPHGGVDFKNCFNAQGRSDILNQLSDINYSLQVNACTVSSEVME